MHFAGFELKWSLDTVVTALGSARMVHVLVPGPSRNHGYAAADVSATRAGFDRSFPFETQNPAITQNLYFAEKFLVEGSLERETVKSYVYQILNLFEMALRFREEEVMPHDVFESWVIWFHDLCAAKNFPEIWPEMKFYYLPDLRAIMSSGIEMLKNGDSESVTQEFFVLVSERVKDPSIKTWILTEPVERSVGRF